MPRVALRQFLRSSFDPVDKTMGSPIIACLSAASLLILASCSFGSINADSTLDADESSTDNPDPNNIGFRVFPSERQRGFSDQTVVREGFIRHFIRRPRPTRRTRISRTSPRPSYVSDELDQSDQPERTPSPRYQSSADGNKDYFTAFGEHGLLMVDIAAKRIDAAVSNIIGNMNKHRNGQINVTAKTLKGAIAGNNAEKYFKHFFKDRWVGIIAHVVQEIVDQFYIGSAMYLRYRGESDTEDYADVSVTAASLQIDMAEDFDQWEINEYEDPVGKTYHCSAQSQTRNDTLQPNLETIKFLDDNGLAAVRPKKNYYQVHQIRRKMCLFGFDPFLTDPRIGSIHKRFKNTLRLMIYNTPGIFPGLKVIRNDLDRKRRREPQIWFSFEAGSGPLSSEFDYDNYFVTVSGDFARIQAYSKMLVALKMHKRLNNFNNSVSYKINLDLGIMEVIMSSFGIALMRDKSASSLLVKALNGVRTEIRDGETVQLEFDEKLKEAADQVDPLLYSSIWLLSMAEKYEVSQAIQKSSPFELSGDFNLIDPGGNPAGQMSLAIVLVDLGRHVIASFALDHHRFVMKNEDSVEYACAVETKNSADRDRQDTIGVSPLTIGDRSSLDYTREAFMRSAVCLAATDLSRGKPEVKKEKRPPSDTGRAESVEVKITGDEHAEKKLSAKRSRKKTK